MVLMVLSGSVICVSIMPNDLTDELNSTKSFARSVFTHSVPKLESKHLSAT
jgi:hypothetical protein